MGERVGWFEIRLMAIRAIRENYRWVGVWKVLRSPVPDYVQLNHMTTGVVDKNLKTWKLLLKPGGPDVVLAWQQGLSEGVFV